MRRSNLLRQRDAQPFALQRFRPQLEDQGAHLAHGAFRLGHHIAQRLAYPSAPRSSRSSAVCEPEIMP